MRHISERYLLNSPVDSESRRATVDVWRRALCGVWLHNSTFVISAEKRRKESDLKFIGKFPPFFRLLTPHYRVSCSSLSDTVHLIRYSMTYFSLVCAFCSSCDDSQEWMREREREKYFFLFSSDSLFCFLLSKKEKTSPHNFPFPAPNWKSFFSYSRVPFKHARREKAMLRRQALRSWLIEWLRKSFPLHDETRKMIFPSDDITMTTIRNFPSSLPTNQQFPFCLFLNIPLILGSFFFSTLQLINQHWWSKWGSTRRRTFTRWTQQCGTGWEKINLYDYAPKKSFIRFFREWTDSGSSNDWGWSW